MTKTMDDKIVALQKKIQEKQAKAGKVKRFNPKTNCSLELHAIRYNLNALSEYHQMLLATQLNALKLSAEDLGVQCIISEYPVESWVSDLKQKIDITKAKKEQAELARLEKKLEDMLSADKKTELELQAIEELLK